MGMKTYDAERAQSLSPSEARCDFAEALRFPAVLQCGAQQILQILLILLPSD